VMTTTWLIGVRVRVRPPPPPRPCSDAIDALDVVAVTFGSLPPPAEPLQPTATKDAATSQRPVRWRMCVPFRFSTIAGSPHASRDPWARSYHRRPRAAVPTRRNDRARSATTAGLALRLRSLLHAGHPTAASS